MILAERVATASDNHVVVHAPEKVYRDEPEEVVTKSCVGFAKGTVHECVAKNELDNQPKFVHWCTICLNKEDNWVWLSSMPFRIRRGWDRKERVKQRGRVIVVGGLIVKFSFQ